MDRSHGYGSPFHALARVEARRMLLDRDIGEVHVGVGDVLLLGRVTRVGEAREPTPVREVSHACMCLKSLPWEMMTS